MIFVRSAHEADFEIHAGANNGLMLTGQWGDVKISLPGDENRIQTFLNHTESEIGEFAVFDMTGRISGAHEFGDDSPCMVEGCDCKEFTE